MAIAFSVVIITIIGIVGAAVLVAASEIMYVPVDMRVEALSSAMPGANCGACGFAGCSDYAGAIAEGKADKLNLCTPGGNAVAKQLGEIMGVTAGDVETKKAIVCCQGSYANTSDKYRYGGVMSCTASTSLFGGSTVCSYGCLGFGDCLQVCKFNAIVVDNGLASIDKERCTGCGACVKSCPKKIIHLETVNNKPIVLCQNKDRGNITRKDCSAGCIGCMKCTKVCPTQPKAISVTDNNSIIDREICIGCGECAVACPVKCIGKFC